jgi:hypothetical protein
MVFLIVEGYGAFRNSEYLLGIVVFWRLASKQYPLISGETYDPDHCDRHAEGWRWQNDNGY